MPTVLHSLGGHSEVGRDGLPKALDVGEVSIVTGSRRRSFHPVSSVQWRDNVFRFRSPAIAFRPAPTEHQSVTTPFSTVNERARHPDPNSLTDLADLGCDFACVHRELGRGSQRPFSSPSFWRYLHFPGTNFLRLRRAAHHLHTVLHLGGGQCSSLGASVRYARACIEFFASPKGTILFGISATSGSFGSGTAQAWAQGA